jgi:hypothetical protein
VSVLPEGRQSSVADPVKLALSVGSVTVAASPAFGTGAALVGGGGGGGVTEPLSLLPPPPPQAASIMLASVADDHTPMVRPKERALAAPSFELLVIRDS